MYREILSSVQYFPVHSLGRRIGKYDLCIDHIIRYHPCYKWISRNTSLQCDEYCVKINTSLIWWENAWYINWGAVMRKLFISLYPYIGVQFYSYTRRKVSIQIWLKYFEIGYCLSSKTQSVQYRLCPLIVTLPTTVQCISSPYCRITDKIGAPWIGEVILRDEEGDCYKSCPPPQKRLI